MQLIDLICLYVESHPRELSPNYIADLKWCVRSYERFLGQKARLDHLNTQLIDAYLKWLLDRGRSPRTARGRRVSLHTLWQFAWEEDWVTQAPKIKKLRITSRKMPVAWSREEVAKLVNEARKLSGLFRVTKISRGPYMAGLFLSLYSTGLRLGDCLSISRDQIHDDGHVTIVCSKTGREVVRYFSGEALEEIDKTNPFDRNLIWPLWARREALYRLVRQLVQRAGIRCGTSRFLRRSGVTQIAAEHGRDAARRFADHKSVATTIAHYIDESQMPTNKVIPRSIFKDQNSR